MKDLTIIVPAFNEEGSLPTFLEDMCEYCGKNGYKLIVVNDGSSDTTGEILDAADQGDMLTVIHHKINRGYGSAIKTAIERVDTEFLITVDADGQHSLDDIGMLFNYLMVTDADMVIGKRDSHQGSRYRRFGKFMIRSIAKLLMSFQITDLNSGMKVYRSDLAKKYIRLCPDTMAYSDIITLVFINQKHLVLEKDIQIRSRISGTSTINTRTALDTILEILNIVILFNPNRIFLPLAIIFVLAGIIWGLPFLLRGEGVQAGTLLLTITGILFFLLGLLAEQLSLIRRSSVD
ncbi:undecaprenyl-phosphate 4-deoxy-4-formamido-L-arabinose transferase [bacterium BMS3Bbin11]|nr:undecaprenyl-phosphate 4-deoxy-4-formamido-L-arabinose transferase [bacterium BMS3Abin11]GBE46057.1 undecaprenyl-phosphate 4-deoxy-4-formamido-L-arabinose transferase [bacterium BMS3Bbin11]